MTNLGNTCFVNAVMQLLAAVPVMRQQFDAHNRCVANNGQ